MTASREESLPHRTDRPSWVSLGLIASCRGVIGDEIVTVPREPRSVPQRR